MTSHLYLLLARIMVMTFVADLVEPFTISDRRMMIAMHTYDKSWNEAEAICAAYNGSLFTTDSAERQKVLMKYFDENTLPNTKDHFWIGLHSPSSLPVGTYGWASCLIIDMTQYSGWASTSEPASPDTNKCAFADKNDQTWKTAPCDTPKSFMCLNVLTDPCTFDAFTSQIPSDPSKMTNTTAIWPHADACKFACLNLTKDGVNCWAVTYDTGNNECTSYFTTDPFFLTASTLTSGGTDIYIKSCYTGTSITREDTSLSITATASTEPTQVCSDYFLPTTTTVAPMTTMAPQTATASVTTTASPTAVPSTAAPTTSTPSTSTPSTGAQLPTTPITITQSISSASSAEASTTSTSSSSLSSPPSSSTQSPSTSSSLTSTSPQSSTSSPSSSSPSSSTCWCQCDVDNDNGLNRTLNEKVAAIIQRLKIDKTVLSSTIRKKISASDDRPAAVSVGVVSIVFMSTLFILIISLDIGRLIRFLKTLKNKRRV